MFALALALLGMLVVAPDAGAVGPGGWDHLGVGATTALASLDGPVLAMNADAPGGAARRRLVHQRWWQRERVPHRHLERDPVHVP
jgi:hypothetical protein